MLFLKKLIKNIFVFFISIFPGKKRTIYWVADKMTDRVLYLSSPNGYLQEVGWINSVKQNRSVDNQDNYIPWLTYPCINFLKEKVKSDMNILEIGAGWSTIFFGKKANAVLSFEDDIQWYDLLLKLISPNVELLLYKEMKDIRKVLDDSKKKFDLAIFDGNDDRIQTSFTVLQYLSKECVIVIDDAERKEYLPIILELENKGYKKINFWGMTPLLMYERCTSVFYQDINSFNI